ncbi:uncharacterized protein LOC123305252 [Chrysoperla carnea]|uniref:uncharacterized protein LOC123305252 n=1 Tax=Chrysoperla carnea TaxID=189513 RepID=UPI001D0774AE|nr:uncharacterized protein LOC123305252 [Chrysoperla carnea]
MIDCLSNLVVNFVTTCAYPELTELKQPFPLPEDLQQEDYMEIFRKLCLWINDFSLIAMKLDKDGLLGSILNLHHTLYDLQSHLESFVICAPPPCVVYACLGGMPFHHVNSCCKLLLRYVEICENTPDAKEVFEVIKKYITTFLKIFNGRSVEISSDTGQYLVKVMSAAELPF